MWFCDRFGPLRWSKSSSQWFGLNREVKPLGPIRWLDTKIGGCYLAFFTLFLYRGEGWTASLVENVTTSEFSPRLKLPPIIWVDRLIGTPLFSLALWLVRSVVRGVLNIPNPQIYLGLNVETWPCLGLSFATFSLFCFILSLVMGKLFLWLSSIQIQVNLTIQHTHTPASCVHNYSLTQQYIRVSVIQCMKYLSLYRIEVRELIQSCQLHIT